jgi:hypothetical protein
MASQAHAGSLGHSSAIAPSRPDPAFSALLQSATVEFLSSLQLLAERARFLTGADGAAIAIEEHGTYMYRAMAGDSSETGTPADKSKAPIARCLSTAKPSVVSSHTSQAQTVKAAVPITQHGQVVGFFDLCASRSTFSDEDLRAVSGLAEMVNTALDHMRAAESAHEHIAEVAPPNAPERAAPLSWHAEPAAEPESKTEAPAPSSSSPLTVHVCQSCGFPISDSRQLCVECERKPDAPKPVAPHLLAAEPDPSWIETHGYTLASLLITALVIAIIYWLR